MRTRSAGPSLSSTAVAGSGGLVFEARGLMPAPLRAVLRETIFRGKIVRGAFPSPGRAVMLRPGWELLRAGAGSSVQAGTIRG
jgi:hypothetical protein